jgi:hypothetical protein
LTENPAPAGFFVARQLELMAAEVMPRLNRAIGARGEKPLREGAGR